MRARVVISRDGNETRRRLQFYSRWRTFAGFYRLAPAFILLFKLKRRHGTFFIKVFDGSLYLQDWEERDDDMAPLPAQA